MKKIKLNSFQLNVLLDENEKERFQFLLNKGVYCIHCKSVCKKGVVDYECQLDSTNDIVVNAKCAECGHPVSRTMEFGEDKTFFKKANKFRQSIGET